jgi:leucyl aminopeptidase
METADPSWRLPLWSPYLSMMDSKVANINNAGTGSFAGSITAALFLEKFVGEGLRWLHVDLFAWNPSSRPGAPEGGEAQVIRALYQLIKERYVR